MEGRASLGLLAAVAVALAAAPASVENALAFDRAAIDRGEVWRLLTHPLVHAGWRHLAWNVAALAILTAALGPFLGRAAWLGAGLASAVASGAGVWLFAPRVREMLGLSAVLHGLFAAGAIGAAPRRRGAAAALLGLLASKLLLERIAPALLPASALATGVAHAAHFYGALGGVAAGGVAVFLRQRRTASATAASAASDHGPDDSRSALKKSASG